MSGHAVWAVIGLVVGAVGVVLVVRALRAPAVHEDL
jgi:LPS O-antigen subunit length determinant protein (WzzB/FepE family)